MKITTRFAGHEDRSLEVIRSDKGRPVTITRVPQPVTASGEEMSYVPSTDSWEPGASSVADARSASRAVQISLKPLTLMVDAEGMAFEPARDMSAEWANQAHRIVDVEAAAPKGKPIIYVVTLAAA